MDKLTIEQTIQLDAITEPYHAGWIAGDTSDQKWKREVAEYCAKNSIEFSLAAKYLKMSGYDD